MQPVGIASQSQGPSGSRGPTLVTNRSSGYSPSPTDPLATRKTATIAYSPFRIIASGAVREAMRSRHFAALRKTVPGAIVDTLVGFHCARRCTVAPTAPDSTRGDATINFDDARVSAGRSRSVGDRPRPRADTGHPSIRVVPGGAQRYLAGRELVPRRLGAAPRNARCGLRRQHSLSRR
jgi:hypothetical protein